MKKNYLTVCALFLIILVMGCDTIRSKIRREKETEKVTSKVIATVGKTSIYLEDFIKKAKHEKQFNPKLVLDDETRKRILNEMIDMELLYQYGVSEGFDKSPDAKHIMINALVRKDIKADIKPTDAQLEAYFNQNKAQFEEVDIRQILIRLPRLGEMGMPAAAQNSAEKVPTREDKLKIANQVLENLKKELGKNFETMAQQYSEDFAAKRGGDMGYAVMDHMMPEIIEAVKNLKTKSEFSGIIETRMGLHIVQLVDRRPGDFARQKMLVRSKYLTDEEKNRYNAYIAKLKSKANITVFSDRVDAVFKEFEKTKPAAL